MKEIYSTKNPVIKEIKKLHKKKYRSQTNQYLIDGQHLVQEAIHSQALIEMIFVTQKGLLEAGEMIQDYTDKTYLISEEVSKGLSDLPTPQGILAVIQKETEKRENLQGKWLLLDNVQDPGNVGTMIRTADAAGFSGVFLGEGTADCYSTKALRSMQGSNFHLPLLEGDLASFITELKKQSFTVYGTELNEEAVEFHKIQPSANIALIMGNEGQGVSAEILEQTDKNLYIPLLGQAESLNVGIAAGILMYHFALATF